MAGPGRRGRAALLAALLVSAALAGLVPGVADATKRAHTLRLATSAPKGTSWAKAFEAFARQIEQGTGGDVTVKVYYGGAAGDERQVFDRLERGQLDGTISGGPICTQLMPSMSVLHLLGLYQSEEEFLAVTHELAPVFGEEAHAHGYALLGLGSVGPIILFARERMPVFAALRKAPLWGWELSGVFAKAARAMGLNIVPTSLGGAADAYEEGRIDGFWSTPIAALGFQWYSQVRYFTPLEAGYLMGCLVLREASLDALVQEHRLVIREQGARLSLRIEVENTRMGRGLVDRVFEKQGLVRLSAGGAFERDFRAAAAEARRKLVDVVVPKTLLERVDAILAARARR